MKVCNLSTVTDNLKNRIGEFKPGCVYTLAGRPLIGKTVVSRNIAAELTVKNKNVLYVSSESPHQNTLDYCFKNGVDYLYQTALTIAEIEDVIKDNSYDTLIIDCYQYLKRENKTDNAALLSKIAKKYGIILIICSNIGRRPEYTRGHRPKGKDLIKRMCDSLWSVSENVILIYRHSYYSTNPNTYDMEFIIEKHKRTHKVFTMDYSTLYTRSMVWDK